MSDSVRIAFRDKMTQAGVEEPSVVQSGRGMYSYFI
jgi:hypothetical protein